MDSQIELREIEAKLKGPDPLTWVFTGDSVTHGALHTYGSRSFSEIISERVRWELSRGSDIVINSGISGNMSSDVLGSIDWRVLRFKPDVVFLMIGINDCSLGKEGYERFECNLKTFVKIVRSHGSHCILNTPNAICADNDLIMAVHLPEYVSIMRNVAKSENIILIDHFEYWNKTKTTKHALISWLDDSVHPNIYGHRAIAKCIFKALSIDDNTLSCSLLIS